MSSPHSIFRLKKQNTEDTQLLQSCIAPLLLAKLSTFELAEVIGHSVCKKKPKHSAWTDSSFLSLNLNLILGKCLACLRPLEDGTLSFKHGTCSVTATAVQMPSGEDGSVY